MRADNFDNKPVETKEVEETTEMEPEIVNDVLTGVVSGCDKLHVREAPNKASASVKIVNANDEVMIDVEESTEDFYKVYTASGIEGFCMKDFIAIQS